MVGNDRPARALICLRYGIGDVVMELPALRALRTHWPRAHLTALGAWPALELLEGDPVVDRLMSVQTFGFRHWWDPGSRAARQQLAAWLRANDFQRILDATHAVAGVRRVLSELAVPGLDADGTPSPVHGKQPPHASSPAQAIWLDAARGWGLRGAHRMPPIRLHIPDRAHRAALRFLDGLRLERRCLVGIAPVASSPLKRWPADRVQALIRRLTREGDTRILLLGVPASEGATLRALRAAAPPGRLHRLPPIHLQSTAAVLSRCRAVVGNDTGLAHMSAAVGTPTIVLFGPTSAQVALPDGAVPVMTPVTCGYRLEDRLGPPECILRNDCLIDDRSCMTRIPVDAVHAAVRRLLH